MKRKHWVIFVVLTVVLLLLLGACAVLARGGSVGNGTTGTISTEVEDCDAEDRRNREAECGFVKAPKKPGKVKKPGKNKPRSFSVPKVNKPAGGISVKTSTRRAK